MVSLKQHTRTFNESKLGQQSLAARDITVGACDVGTQSLFAILMKQEPCILRVYLGFLLPNLIIDQQFNESSTVILQFQTLISPIILGDHSIYFLCRHLQYLKST